MWRLHPERRTESSLANPSKSQATQNTAPERTASGQTIVFANCPARGHLADRVKLGIGDVGIQRRRLGLVRHSDLIWKFHHIIYP
jgi:hypothetical protein